LRRFLVSVRGGTPSDVLAANWLSALGDGLEQLGIVGDIDRLACEVLPNGTVIARDVRTGAGYIVQPAGPTEPDEVPTLTSPAPDMSTTESDPRPRGPSSEPLREWATQEVLAVAEYVTGEYPPSEPYSVEIEVTDPHVEDQSVGSSDPAAELAEKLELTLIDTVRSTPSEETAWQRALEVAAELVPSESGAALRVVAGGELEFLGACGPQAPKVMGVRLPAGTGVAGFSVSRALSVVVAHPNNDPRFFRQMDDETGYRTKELLCVPVSSRGKVRGCIELLNPLAGVRGERGFGARALELIELVATALSDRLNELAG